MKYIFKVTIEDDSEVRLVEAKLSNALFDAWWNNYEFKLESVTNERDDH
jgi:hypothetical protein